MNFIRPLRITFALSISVVTTLTLSADQQREQEARRTAASDAATKVDINHADQAALARVPEIGPELAAKIVAARPFKTIDELNRVNGISTEQLEHIRAKVAVVSTRTKSRDGLLDSRPERSNAADVRGKRKVDLNTADVEKLEAIPSIGPEAARAIVAARPFATVDDLQRVKGLTAEQLELIKADVEVAAAGKSAKKRKQR